MVRSRLEKRLERKTKINLFFSVVGIMVIMYAVLRFGVPLIADFGLFMSGNKDAQSQKNEQDSFISPPFLDPMPPATNSARITVSGKANKDTDIEIYVNDVLEDNVTTDSKGEFSAIAEIESGENTVKARINKNGKKSAFSDVITISFTKSAPKISLNSPSDGQKFEKERSNANVSGNIDVNGTVTVNGFWAVIDQNNNFSYSLPLKNGANEIKIIATDQAGNQSEKIIKVNYSQ